MSEVAGGSQFMGQRPSSSKAGAMSLFSVKKNM
jgi:hypothetical protein